MTLVPASSRGATVAQVLGADAGLLSGLGLLGWDMASWGTDGNIAMTSQTLYGMLVPTVAGQSYTGVKLNVAVAATGAQPTGFFVGLGSTALLGAAGTMLAQSGNLKASTSLTAGQGIALFPFSAAYVETVTGLRYVLAFQDGVFGGTNVTFARKGTLNAIASAGAGGTAFVVTAGTTVTAFAANGQAIAANFSVTGSIGFWAALY